MKKILTLFIALGAIATVQAQMNDGRYENRDVILGEQNKRPYDNNRTYDDNSRYGNSYHFTARERDQQIERINREYENRIRQVQRDRWMRGYEKRRQLERLEDQRRNEIRQVWERFKSNRNQYRDNDYRRNDRRW